MFWVENHRCCRFIKTRSEGTFSCRWKNLMETCGTTSPTDYHEGYGVLNHMCLVFTAAVYLDSLASASLLDIFTSNPPSPHPPPAPPLYNPPPMLFPRREPAKCVFRRNERAAPSVTDRFLEIRNIRLIELFNCPLNPAARSCCCLMVCVCVCVFPWVRVAWMTTW